MLNAYQLRDLVIIPALQDLVLFSDNAVQLLLFTCAVESKGGSYLKQLIGPALGIYQMEPETYNDIWQNYLPTKTNLCLSLIHNFDVARMPSEDKLIYDLRFATAMTRIHYKRVPETLPPKDNLDAIWQYYKKYYNSDRGAALKDRSIEFYLTFLKA